MSAPTIIFFASAVIAMLAALVAVSSRDAMRSLAGFAVAVAAVIVPLVQLRAPLVAGVLLVVTAVIVLLLGALARLQASTQHVLARSRVYALLAGAGLLGFVWVLLATGSRQVVESGPPLTPGNAFGNSSALLLELAETQLVAALVVGLLALCCVIAAVLSAVAGTDADAGTDAVAGSVAVAGAEEGGTSS
jgi:NADH:ubiquinone oxidoreductase subunit 6 (subunit J)